MVTSLPAPRGTGTVHPHDTRMARIARRVLERDRYACWICGHGEMTATGRPGYAAADGIDHVVPAAECEVRGISLWDGNNMRAAHSKRQCPVCAQAAAALGNTTPGNRAGYCNAMRGSLSIQAARLKIAKRTGLEIVGLDASAYEGNRPAGQRGERSWD